MSATGPPAGQSSVDPIPPEPPRRPWWAAKRIALGALGVMLLSGLATAVLALNEVDKVVDALGESRAVKLAPRLLARSTKGAPETLLLVGNDQRPAPKDNPNGFVIPHSNEMLLVRIDPGKPTISMMSIPRELQVTIYPHGAAPVTTRINAAYGIGGAELMTETIKRVLGISVNHVFVLSFPKFKRAVDELGCVYMTVDRRYYHVNEPGGEQYFEINLQPGYQRLCGDQALQFVANRHEDTSLTRDARDQRFLLEAKAEYGATLFENREKFERILGRTVETDLHGTGQVLDLLELLVESAGKPVRQVPFNVNLLPTYDTASPQQIEESVQSFLGGTSAIHRRRLAAPRPKGHHHRPAGSGVALTPTTAAELDQARSQASNLPFQLEYPRARDSYAGAEPDSLRLYTVSDRHGHPHSIYAIVIDRGLLGEFYDVQGTNWNDPPLLGDPGQAVRSGRRTYELFYAGEQVRTIAWHESGATYWIQNTLTNSISPTAMLAMAEQTVPVIYSTVPAGAETTVPVGVDLKPRAAPATGSATTVGALLGLLDVVAIGLLAMFAVVRQRELRSLRDQVAQALALEALHRPLMAGAGAGVAPPLARSPGRPARAARRLPGGGRALVLAGAAAGLIVLAVGIGHFAGGGGASSRRAAHSAPVSVAVFNATTTTGAAHRVAATLRASRLPIGQIGDINAGVGPGPGTYVLYPSGAGEQAHEIARLLPALSPTVAPIQPQLQSVVGHRDEIVVLLD